MRYPAIIALSIIGLAAIMLFAIVLLRNFNGPTPDDAQGLQKLRDIAATANPIILALERYHHDHGTFPGTLSSLSPEYLSGPISGRWSYYFSPKVDKNSYRLVTKISIDPLLYYDYASKVVGGWVYDPGDGTPGIDIRTGKPRE
jgi:hypothetical protein